VSHVWQEFCNTTGKLKKSRNDLMRLAHRFFFYSSMNRVSLLPSACNYELQIEISIQAFSDTRSSPPGLNQQKTF